MKKLLLPIVALLFLGGSLQAQDLVTQTGHISFFSKKGKIKADNNEITSKLNTAENSIVFSVPIQGFKFENAMMQKHFNQEGVMDSQQFPKAKFKGTISSEKPIDWTKDGSFEVIVKGDLTIKDQTKAVEEKGLITIEGGKIKADATFDLDRFLWGVDGKKGSISQVLAIEVNVLYEK